MGERRLVSLRVGREISDSAFSPFFLVVISQIELRTKNFCIFLGKKVRDIESGGRQVEGTKFLEFIRVHPLLSNHVSSLGIADPAPRARKFYQARETQNQGRGWYPPP